MLTSEDADLLASSYADEVLGKLTDALMSPDLPTAMHNLSAEFEGLRHEFVDAIVDLSTDEAGILPHEAETGGMAAFTVEGAITKRSDEQRKIWGWASVVTKNGKTVVDRQGDMVEIHELQDAVHKFMESRRGDTMHNDPSLGAKGTSKVVDSIVFTADLQKALGIDLGQEGWFVGMHVHDDNTWERVKKGELRAFSFGGKAFREDS